MLQPGTTRRLYAGAGPGEKSGHAVAVVTAWLSSQGERVAGVSARGRLADALVHLVAQLLDDSAKRRVAVECEESLARLPGVLDLLCDRALGDDIGGQSHSSLVSPPSSRR